jgi:hypothetical protein
VIRRPHVLRVLGLIAATVFAAGSFAAAAAKPVGLHNLRAAGADAAVLMHSLHLPASAVRSAGEPFGDHGLLARAPGSGGLGGAQVVDQTAFWTSPRSPHAILAFVKADPSSGITSFSNGSGSVPGGAYRFLAYGYPPIPNVLQSRELTIEVTALAGGRSGIRADAIGAWIRPRAKKLVRIPAALVRLAPARH